jgi:trk system potassium uptake protein TrkA
MSVNRQFGVLGLGRFGQSVVKTLIANKCEVMCVDNNKEIVEEMAEYCHNVYKADITDKKAVDELSLNNLDVLIIAIGDNLESTIMAIMYAKEKGVKHIIAKAKSDMQASVLKKLGADRIVMPEKDMGSRIAMSLISPNMLDYINLSDKFAIAEIEPKKEWIGKDLIASNIRATTGMNVVAIRRKGDVIVSPQPKEVIRENDILFVVGDSKQIQKVSKGK